MASYDSQIASLKLLKKCVSNLLKLLMFLMGSTLSGWELVSQNVKECGGYLNQRDLPNKNNYYLVLAQSTYLHKNVNFFISLNTSKHIDVCWKSTCLHTE